MHFYDNRISFRRVHSCFVIAFLTIRAPVLHFIVVRSFEQREFGTGNNTVQRLGTVFWIFRVFLLLIHATSSIVNDFTYHKSKSYLIFLYWLFQGGRTVFVCSVARFDSSFGSAFL